MLKTTFYFLILFFPLLSIAQWAQIGGDINGAALNERSGIETDLSADGNIMAIGAPWSNINGTRSGTTRVFQYDGSAWIQRGNNINGSNEDNLFGTTVKLSADGNVLAIGASQFGASSETPPGYVRVFDWDGTDWIQRGNDITENINQDNFGAAISMNSDGNLIAVGAYTNSEIALFSGQTRVYEWDGVNWNQLGSEINGENQNDLSGVQVNLNAIGSILSIGETRGTGDGRVRVFEWNGSNWNQKGDNINGENSFGLITSMDEDGTTLFIGGNTGSMSQGISKIFEFNLLTT